MTRRKRNINEMIDMLDVAIKNLEQVRDEMNESQDDDDKKEEDDVPPRR